MGLIEHDSQRRVSAAFEIGIVSPDSNALWPRPSRMLIIPEIIEEIEGLVCRSKLRDHCGGISGVISQRRDAAAECGVIDP